MPWVLWPRLSYRNDEPCDEVCDKEWKSLCDKGKEDKEEPYDGRVPRIGFCYSATDTGDHFIFV